MALYSSAVVMKGFNSNRKAVLSRNCYCESKGWPSYMCHYAFAHSLL